MALSRPYVSRYCLLLPRRQTLTVCPPTARPSTRHHPSQTANENLQVYPSEGRHYGRRRSQFLWEKSPRTMCPGADCTGLRGHVGTLNSPVLTTFERFDDFERYRQVAVLAGHLTG